MAESDYPALETLAKNVVKEKQKFERLEMTKEQLLEMFAVSNPTCWLSLPCSGLTRVFFLLQYNPFKVHIINDKIADGTSTTVYRCGSMVDLCRGPHIPHTGKVKALAVLKVCNFGSFPFPFHYLNKSLWTELLVVFPRRFSKRKSAKNLRSFFPRQQEYDGVQEVP